MCALKQPCVHIGHVQEYPTALRLYKLAQEKLGRNSKQGQVGCKGCSPTQQQPRGFCMWLTCCNLATCWELCICLIVLTCEGVEFECLNARCVFVWPPLLPALQLLLYLVCIDNNSNEHVDTHKQTHWPPCSRCYTSFAQMTTAMDT